jgi:hypothetical protein
MKLEDKQTAVEWLFRALWDTPKDKLTWWAIFDKAMAIEKQQIINAYSMGLSDEGIKSIHTKANAEEYYNETYGE